MSAKSRRVFFSYKRKYVHEVPVKCLVKLAQEKSLVMWTDFSELPPYTYTMHGLDEGIK